ncbi:MAG: Arm DNA-binding domain-containing protein, partial [Clostridium celatum]|nr:Arm DNA-binding domain-containing protein [Clostridium celatum]
MQGHVRNLGTSKAPKWQYLFYIYKDGKRKCITKSGFQKKSDANKALRLAIKQYEDNSYVDNTRITFREIAEEYIEYYIKENRKANTYAKYKSQYNNYLDPLIGDMKIANINARTINSIISKAKKMNPNKPLSNTSLQTLFTLMSSIFNRAIKHELLVKNPCINADRPRRDSIDYEILSMEEINI